MSLNQPFQPDNIGSIDWNGGKAPAGGTHTGTATIVMKDGAVFVVAHDASEVRRKTDLHAVAQTAPTLVAFDVPNRPVPIVLDVGQIDHIV